MLDLYYCNVHKSLYILNLKQDKYLKLNILIMMLFQTLWVGSDLRDHLVLMLLFYRQVNLSLGGVK